MKKVVFLCLFLCFGKAFAQITIQGTVLGENNEPLIGADVYLNNTTIGTITNNDGYFSLEAKEGNYDLITSFIGYETYSKTLDLKTNQEIEIQLKEKAGDIGEVVIKNNVFDQDWQYSLARFKQTFIGRTNLSKDCKLLNPKTLRFDFDAKTNTLTAYAIKPLQFKHKGLGYLITYDLLDFKIEGNYVSFIGYSKYENLKKKASKKVQENRKRAFLGSRLHFMRSLRNETLEQEGFLVNQFRRERNPERPTEKEIKHARELIRLNGNKINFNIKEPKTALDSAMVTLNKAIKPKVVDVMYQRNVVYKDMLLKQNNETLLKFNDYLQVIYKNEPEEEAFAYQGLKKRKPLNVQVSNIVLLAEPLKIDKNGYLTKPLDLIAEGYWSFEQFGEMLPLNYELD